MMLTDTMQAGTPQQLAPITAGPQTTEYSEKNTIFPNALQLVMKQSEKCIPDEYKITIKKIIKQSNKKLDH